MRWLITTLFAMPAITMAQTICIDPGHPSEVGIGTEGKRTSEVKVVWEVAQLLKKQLTIDGYRVVMTKRELMEKVSNRERADIANQSDAHLLIRLHCDASPDSGFGVYYPSQTGTTQGVTGPDNRTLAASARAARAFHLAMSARLKGDLKDQGLRTDLQTAVGAKQGALTGSIFSKVPVVLVEMVVLTNLKDEAFIISQSGRRKMVEALADGVRAAVPRRR